MKTMPSEYDAKRIFLGSMGAIIALKFLLAWGFPLTSDEAFFYQWGLKPDWGFSDHPPMVGWMLSLLLLISDMPWVLRTITVLLTPLIGLGIVDVLLRSLPIERRASAWLAGSIYLWMPFSVLFVLVTTDTPLLIFMALSAWLYFRADACKENAAAALWYVASGLALGLAGLSKYFSVLLAVAYFVHLVGYRRDRLWAVLPLAALALACASINIIFNAQHGWTNVMFNVFNRHERAGFQLKHAAIYIAMMVYLLMPWLVFELWRSRTVKMQSAAKMQSLAFVLFATPFVVFLAVSFLRQVGLHWVLGFVPMYMAWVAWRLDAIQLKKCFRWTVTFGGIHLLLVFFIAFAPTSVWQSTPLFERAVFLKETPSVVQEIKRDMPADSTLMAVAYSPASMLAYYSREYVPVFGVGRHHARQDDLQIDFRQYAGRNIRIFSYSALAPDEYKSYFQSVQTREINVQGVRYYILDGTGFNFEAFRSNILSNIAQSFHQVPKWLPVLGSPFCERYGFAQCSPKLSQK
jgi:Dolichyl-phosphate-mannose-protein mannosyltransferase